MMLIVGATDLRKGRKVKLIKAVDIQRVLLLGIRFELCTPKGRLCKTKRGDLGVGGALRKQAFDDFTTAVHWMNGERNIASRDSDALRLLGPVGGERTG